MSNVVIKVEDLSKQYRLGLVGSGTLSHDLNRWWAKTRGKDDPILKIGESNQIDGEGGEYVWALKDVNFEVKRGEVLAIIGKNGAGKSTLLKILSRVTGPTTGVFKAKGRIASMLEVGTGFHPELTGLENIYLNGAILGMNRNEIRRKLDEIISFAGVSKYIDTPVKRYSSGMKVRLGFAVAAHLEPEILVIDEVLAVGDLEFQRKCIGKMKDVAGDGRTVLFVSHNMNSIQNLCTRGILMDKGTIAFEGSTEETISKYRESAQDMDIGSPEAIRQRTKGKISGGARFTKICILDSSMAENNFITEGEDLFIKMDIMEEEKIEDLHVGISIYAEETNVNLASVDKIDIKSIMQDGKGQAIIKLSNVNLKPGIYIVYFWLGRVNPFLTYDALNYLTSPVRLNIVQKEKTGIQKNSAYIKIDGSLES